jgi:uncharacterized protein YciI
MTAHFAVIREAGPGWSAGGITEQPQVSEHTAFMHSLAKEGLVLFGGPLAGSEAGHLRVLLVVAADTEAEIRGRLADDPWTITDQLLTVSVEPWKLLIGEERLSAASATTH